MRQVLLWWLPGALGCVLLLGAPAAEAQTVASTLAGIVKSEEGEPVADAIVQARSEATGMTRATVSDARGRYRFDALSPGIWVVVARVGDGELSDSRSVQLRLQRTTKLDFTVGTGFSERVIVRAEAPLVDRKQTTGTLSVSGDQAENLPVAGRAITDLALLDSSVRREGHNFGLERGAVFTVNGQGGRSNSFLVDGMENNDLTFGSTVDSFFSQQIIKEFVLLTHQYAPEFGRATGGILNIITRQGANERTWDMFVQGTSDDWNETGDFVEDLPESDVDQDATRQYQAGVTFGGPFKRDKAFYFAAYEHQRNDNLHPYTGVDRNGVQGGRFVAPLEVDNFFLRTDFNLGANTLMVRFSLDDRSSGNHGVGGVNTPETGFGIEESDFQFLTALTSVITPRLLSETRFLVSFSDSDQFANSDEVGVTRPSGVFGGNVLNRQWRNEDKFQFVQNFTVRAGSHTAKFGFDVIKSRTEIKAKFNPNGSFLYEYDIPFEPGDCGDLFVTQTQVTNPDGTVFCVFDPNGIDDDGDGVIDEPGNIYSYPLYYTLITGDAEETFDDTKVALFAQDKVEVGRRWLLEYGLRYDVSSYTLPSDARIESTIPNGGAGVDRDNLAPRFGFTFTPRVDGKSVIRGGAGIFYDKLVLAFPAVAGITSDTKIGLFPPQGFAFEFTEDEVDEPPEFLLFPEPLTMRFTTAPELETPYTVQYNIGFERALGTTSAFRADLIRALGYHLPLMRDLNPVSGLIEGVYGFPLLLGLESECPVDLIDPDVEVGVPCHAADPSRGSMAALTTEGRSWYTGLNLNYRWRRDGSWLHVSYTLSKAENQGFDPLKNKIYLPPDSMNLSGEKGRADTDRRQLIVLSSESGLGWMGVRASTVVQFATGLSFNVTTGQDGNYDGILTDRPAGVDRNEGEDSSLDAINAVRDQDVVDLEPIRSLDEENFFQVDLRLFRPFLFDEEKGKGEVFLQVFNVLDRENVGLVEGRAISPSFGRAIGLAGPPRTVEIGLKFGY